MTNIRKYTTKKGKTVYFFNLYVGVDPKTKKTIRKKVRCQTKKEAQLELARLQYQIKSGKFDFNKPQIITFNELYHRWLENEYSQRNLKASTVTTTERNFKLHILPYFGEFDISKITAEDVYKAVRTWENEKIKKTNQLKNYVSNVLQYGVVTGLLGNNVAIGIRVRKHDQQITRDTIGNYYEEDELNRFLMLTKQYYKGRPQPFIFFSLLAFTGMRKGEAFALTWDDIDFNKHTIDINKTLSKAGNELVIQSPKTKGSKRTLTVPPKIIRLLKSWQIKQREYLFALGTNSNPGHLVFSNTKGELLQPTKSTYWLSTIQNKYNLKHVTAHGFRHTFATLSFAHGMDVKTVSKYLGHSNIDTTMDIYTAVTKEQENNASQIMDKLINL
ncbi:site-specific integrase [Fructilactobacillus hinvesii]|uniref:Site-specific integrase n=1 Tax=Fructilactobacillus hinvesii TaxID=2940300 RepID=A0ABY5BRJ7_9LACO|nr:site-specific integrase [Fructilactobacillus hinvesii]USS87730.1 site-specific integrase [Fructilactobacillus hinvesii]